MDRRLTFLQKKGNTKTGSEMQRDKESAAEIMRQKQAAGEFAFQAHRTPLIASPGR